MEGNEAGSERYRLLLKQLGNLGFERGKGVITSIMAGVLVVLRSFKHRKKLEARS